MSRTALCALAALGLLVARLDGAPLAEKYLLEGKLAEGEKALQKRLAEKPDDDEARFGLAVVQFFAGFERLGTSLYKHGLKTTSAFGVLPALRGHFPENPKPERLTHDAARQFLQTWVADLDRAGVTLDGIKDEKVKLPLPLGRIKIDLLGVGKPVSAALLLGATDAQAGKLAEAFVISFDRGDAAWLRGYCHLLAAWGEFVLAMDTQRLFDCVAHRLFAAADTPFAFLREEELVPKAPGGPLGYDQAFWTDVVAAVHLCLRAPVKEPERLKAVLKHLEGMVANGKAMWKYILAETDDDHEWIPNPRQKSVTGFPVNQAMIDSWRSTLDEVERVLQGKTLLPFWRGKPGQIGVNLRRAFTDPPKEVDFVLWVQGTAAAPYLEKGTFTPLADPKTVDGLSGVFGGRRFFGYAFWFN
ncbi:MAG: hypothetical protein U0797_03650 [Gemmataceae bacterium]